jgi:hypothetical protein
MLGITGAIFCSTNRYMPAFMAWMGTNLPFFALVESKDQKFV